MWLNFDLIRADFLQRTRSYSFLIVLGATIYIAYIFVPPHEASYTTLAVGNFKGNHTSAWVGVVTAMMSNFFLALAGFYLVSSGIQKDIRTRLGQIIATTSISNYSYLQSKAISNFLVLLIIIIVVLITSMVIFVFRSDYQFEMMPFIKPFLILSIPTMFLVAHLAVIAEVIFKNKTVLQGVLGYFMFTALIPIAMINHPAMVYLNPLGVNYVMDAIKADIFSQFGIEETKIFIGFVFRKQAFQFFTWSGTDYSSLFILSRFAWMILGVAGLSLFSLFFHRFDIRKKEKKLKIDVTNNESRIGSITGKISLDKLDKIKYRFSILPLIMTELKLLIRRPNRFYYIMNLGLWTACIFSPLKISIGVLLPILLFLQLDKWSTLPVKDDDNRTIDFILSSFKPLRRVVSAQLIAGFAWTQILALPILLRFLFNFDLNGFALVILGCLFVISFSYALGSLTKSRKLFEILFTVLTVAVVQKSEVIGYLGSPAVSVYAVITFVSLVLLILAKQLQFKSG